nr:GAF domain-containing protein [Deinobacterium chartae]
MAPPLRLPAHWPYLLRHLSPASRRDLRSALRSATWSLDLCFESKGEACWYAVQGWREADGWHGVCTDVHARRQQQLRGERLRQTASELALAREPREVLEVVVQQARAALGSSRVLVVQRDADGAHVRVLAQHGEPRDAEISRWPLPLDAGCALCTAIREDQALFLVRPDRLLCHPYAHSDSSAAAVAVLPLRAYGRTFGALSLEFGQPRGFDGPERAFMTEFADLCAGALERARVYALERELREQAEREAAERRVSEERYRALVLTGSSEVWISDPQSGQVRLYQVRQPLESQTESDPWAWLETVHPDDRETARQRWQQALDTLQPFESRHRRLEGDRWRYVVSRGVPLFDEHGRVREWVGSITDVTDRVLARTRLEELNAELEGRVRERTAQLEASTRALRAFADFAERTGSETRVETLVHEALEVLRQTIGERSAAVFFRLEGSRWRAQNWLGLLPSGSEPLELSADDPVLRSAAANTDALFCEDWRTAQGPSAAASGDYGAFAFYPLNRHFGRAYALLALGLRDSAAWSAENRAVFRAVGRGLAVALERAETNARLEQQNAVLGARTAALEAFSALSRDLAFETDPMRIARRAQQIVLSLLPGGYATYFEPVGDRWRLRAATGFLGHPLAEYSARHGLPLEATRDLYLPWRSGQPRYQSRSAPWEDPSRNGNDHAGASACLPVQAGGRPRGVLAVTLYQPHPWGAADRAMLETAAQHLGLALERSDAAAALAEQHHLLEQKSAQLEALNDELEAFAYSVSHDLRTPVRHVLGFARLLEQRLEDRLSEREARYLHNVMSATERMGALIDELLSFSRVGREALRLETVDLAALTELVRSDLEPETMGRRVRWEIGPLPQVQADGGLLRQVLTNLLSNALKYSRTRPEAVIRISALEAGDEIVLSVADNGVGFDPKYAHKLFGVFQRLHREGEFEGIGIGLANVRRIVGRHGGRVWAEGQPGEGATFYFSLPRESRAPENG